MSHPYPPAPFPFEKGKGEDDANASVNEEGRPGTNPSPCPLPSAEGKGTRGVHQRRENNRPQRNGMVGAARELRSNSTEAERVLWEALRRKQAGGMRFRRQRVIGPYIVDFCCLDQKLVVEVDGTHHHEAEYRAYDLERTEYLEANGFRVLRFDNADVMQDVEGVVRRINPYPPAPFPSAEEQGENDPYPPAPFPSAEGQGETTNE